MAPPFLRNRAQFRDSIRRKLGIVPPADVNASNPEGAQPTNYPYPTNQQIIDAMDDAIRDINRACGYHSEILDVPVAAVASSSFGPFTLALSDFTPNTGSTTYTPSGFVNDIRRALWVASDSTPPVILEAKMRDNMDRSGTFNYWAMPPSTPQFYYIESYNIYFAPAQAAAGTYRLTIGQGVSSFVNDTDTLDQIPFDYQNIFEYQSIFNLSMTATMDVEWKDRAAAYGQKAAEGIRRFKEWVEGGTGAPQPRMQFGSYRGGYGTQRIVR